MKKLLLSLGSIFLLASCSTATTTTVIETSEPENTSQTTTIEETTTISTNPIVRINLSNNKTITCELYPEVAPITVANFLSLVDQEYYSNTIFHRVIPGFMVQTGGFYLEDQPDEEYPIPSSKPQVPTIKGEFENNGIKNDLKHEAGVLSMARATPYDSASNQFFICVATCDWLDKDYAAFGKTIDESSLAAAVEISEVMRYRSYFGFTDYPVEPISITSIKRVKSTD